jgi:hypothetical protein
MVRPSVEGRPGPTFTPIGAWLQDDTPTDRTIRRLAHGRDRAGGTHVDAASKAAALFTASGHRGQEIIFSVENSDFFLGIASAAFPSMVVLSTMGILVFGLHRVGRDTRRVARLDSQASSLEAALETSPTAYSLALFTTGSIWARSSSTSRTCRFWSASLATLHVSHSLAGRDDSKRHALDPNCRGRRAIARTDAWVESLTKLLTSPPLRQLASS